MDKNLKQLEPRPVDWPVLQAIDARHEELMVDLRRLDAAQRHLHRLQSTRNS